MFALLLKLLIMDGDVLQELIKLKNKFYACWIRIRTKQRMNRSKAEVSKQ